MGPPSQVPPAQIGGPNVMFPECLEAMAAFELVASKAAPGLYDSWQAAVRSSSPEQRSLKAQLQAAVDHYRQQKQMECQRKREAALRGQNPGATSTQGQGNGGPKPFTEGYMDQHYPGRTRYGAKPY